MQGTVSRLLGTSLLATGVLLGASVFSPANAFTVVNNNQTGGNPTSSDIFEVQGLVEGDFFNVNWLLEEGTVSNDNDTVPVDLTATATFQVIAIDNGLLQLAVSIANTTNPGSYTERLSLTALGLTTGNNTVTSVAFDTQGNTFDGVSTANFPAFPTDLCVFTGPNCAGGGNPNESLNPGDSDSFILNISGDFVDNQAVTLDTFATKWQTGNGSFEFPGTPDGEKVPEPSTTAALGLLGLASLKFLKKRKGNSELN